MIPFPPASVFSVFADKSIVNIDPFDKSMALLAAITWEPSQSEPLILTPAIVMVAVAFSATTMRSEVGVVASLAMEMVMLAPSFTVRTPLL